MSTYRIMFLGDIVGRPGREIVLDKLSSLVNKHNPEFIIVNGENSAGGVGITPDIAESLYKEGVDAITLGNHAFNKNEVATYLDSGRPIVRPHNMPRGTAGKGLCQVRNGNITLNIINLCGRVFMDGYNDPFEAIDDLLPECKGEHILIDFHAEATSEKVAFGFHVAGRATAVLGTHTHIPTADESILVGGTAYITDVGMCGPYPSVIGMDKDRVLHRFKTSLPTRFEVAEQPGVICGVLIDVLKVSGRATRIERIRVTAKTG